jgi:hypothetical protein
MDRGAAGVAMQNQLDAAQIALHLADTRDCPGRVKNARRDLVDVFFLGDRENSALRSFSAASIARSVAGRPAPIGDATPGNRTASRNGRTGSVIRSDMKSLWGPRMHPLCHGKTRPRQVRSTIRRQSGGGPTRREQANLRP